GSSNDAAEVDEGLFVDLVLIQQFWVVAEVPQEPVELPKRPLGRVQPARERPSLERFGFENDEPNRKEGSIGMPPVGSPLHASQEQPFERSLAIELSCMQTRNMTFHGFTSEGWANEL